MGSALVAVVLRTRTANQSALTPLPAARPAPARTLYEVVKDNREPACRDEAPKPGFFSVACREGVGLGIAALIRYEEAPWHTG